MFLDDDPVMMAHASREDLLAMLRSERIQSKREMSVARVLVVSLFWFGFAGGFLLGLFLPLVGG